MSPIAWPAAAGRPRWPRAPRGRRRRPGRGRPGAGAWPCSAAPGPPARAPRAAGSGGDRRLREAAGRVGHGDRPETALHGPEPSPARPRDQAMARKLRRSARFVLRTADGPAGRMGDAAAGRGRRGFTLPRRRGRPPRRSRPPGRRRRGRPLEQDHAEPSGRPAGPSRRLTRPAPRPTVTSSKATPTARSLNASSLKSLKKRPLARACPNRSLGSTASPRAAPWNSTWPVPASPPAEPWRVLTARRRAPCRCPRRGRRRPGRRSRRRCTARRPATSRTGRRSPRPADPALALEQVARVDPREAAGLSREQGHAADVGAGANVLAGDAHGQVEVAVVTEAAAGQGEAEQVPHLGVALEDRLADDPSPSPSLENTVTAPAAPARATVSPGRRRPGRTRVAAEGRGLQGGPEAVAVLGAALDQVLDGGRAPGRRSRGTGSPRRRRRPTRRPRRGADSQVVDAVGLDVAAVQGGPEAVAVLRVGLLEDVAGPVSPPAEP